MPLSINCATSGTSAGLESGADSDWRSGAGAAGATKGGCDAGNNEGACPGRLLSGEVKVGGGK
jgi:hypothetical protein